MQILEDTDETFVLPIIHWEDRDTVDVLVVEDKYLFITPVGGYWEYSGEVGSYLLLGIDDIVKEVDGACIQCFHRFFFVWGCALGLGGLDVLTDIFHVTLFSVHERR